jgi:hypothetical protein
MLNISGRDGNQTSDLTLLDTIIINIFIYISKLHTLIDTIKHNYIIMIKISGSDGNQTLT